MIHTHGMLGFAKSRFRSPELSLNSGMSHGPSAGSSVRRSTTCNVVDSSTTDVRAPVGWVRTRGNGRWGTPSPATKLMEWSSIEGNVVLVNTTLQYICLLKYRLYENAAHRPSTQASYTIGSRTTIQENQPAAQIAAKHSIFPRMAPYVPWILS